MTEPLAAELSLHHFRDRQAIERERRIRRRHHATAFFLAGLYPRFLAIRFSL
ncbi:MAG TPA: hypothetical protein VGK54_10245 [Chloroflexota bacterium]